MLRPSGRSDWVQMQNSSRGTGGGTRFRNQDVVTHVDECSVPGMLTCCLNDFASPHAATCRVPFLKCPDALNVLQMLLLGRFSDFSSGEPVFLTTLGRLRAQSVHIRLAWCLVERSPLAVVCLMNGQNLKANDLQKIEKETLVRQISGELAYSLELDTIFNAQAMMRQIKITSTRGIRSRNLPKDLNTFI